MSDEHEILTQDAYTREIEDLAKQCIEHAREHEEELSTVIHETVDGHHWVIWSRFHAPVLQFSDNPEAAGEFGGLEEVLRSRGISGLFMLLARAAMIRDVEDAAGMLMDEEDEPEDEAASR